MADNNITYLDKKPISISAIWTAQTPLMLSWLAISFVGMVVLYLAMSLSVVSI